MDKKKVGLIAAVAAAVAGIAAALMFWRKRKKAG